MNESIAVGIFTLLGAGVAHTFDWLSARQRFRHERRQLHSLDLRSACEDMMYAAARIRVEIKAKQPDKDSSIRLVEQSGRAAWRIELLGDERLREIASKLGRATATLGWNIEDGPDELQREDEEVRRLLREFSTVARQAVGLVIDKRSDGKP